MGNCNLHILENWVILEYHILFVLLHGCGKKKDKKGFVWYLGDVSFYKDKYIHIYTCIYTCIVTITIIWPKKRDREPRFFFITPFSDQEWHRNTYFFSSDTKTQGCLFLLRPVRSLHFPPVVLTDEAQLSLHAHIYNHIYSCFKFQNL